MSEQENSDAAGPPADGFRAGYVALCGRPNVGKSTLLNALVGEHLAVVTKLPQTTRQRMLGIWTTDEFQAVLVDTPGIHKAKSALNKFMVAEALRSAQDVDVVLMLAEAPRLPDGDAAAEWEPGSGAKAVLDALIALDKPLILVLTKCDRLAHRDHLLPVVDRWRSLHAFAEVVATSGLEGKGLEALREAVVSRLPAGPAYYSPDQLSDRDLRWHASELIRAELFEQLAEEVPYSCAVTIDSFKEDESRDRVTATVHVERDSQKGIVIGKGAKRIREVSMRARARISALTGRPCDLRLEVRVNPHWTKDARQLRELGYWDKGAG